MVGEKVEHFQGKGTDLQALQSHIEQYLKADGFRVQTSAPSEQVLRTRDRPSAKHRLLAPGLPSAGHLHGLAKRAGAAEHVVGTQLGARIPGRRRRGP